MKKYGNGLHNLDINLEVFIIVRYLTEATYGVTVYALAFHAEVSGSILG